MDQNAYASKVRESYAPHERTKLEELKELDKKVKRPPAIFAYIFGSLAALLLGVGMCLAMKTIGTSVFSDAALMALGVSIGCVGIVLCIANYYIHRAMLSSRKKKYGSRILELSDELLHADE